MFGAIIIVMLLIVFLTRWFMEKRKAYPPRIIFRAVFPVFIIVLSIYLLSFILSYYDLALPGYRSSGILFSGACIFGIASYFSWYRPMHDPHWLLAFFAFLAAMSAFLVIGDILESYGKGILYNGPHYRLVLNRRPFGPAELELAKKGGFLEQRFQLTTISGYYFLEFSSVDSIRIKDWYPDSVGIHLYHNDTLNKSPVIEVVRTGNR